jgi:hypothetical protein
MLFIAIISKSYYFFLAQNSYIHTTSFFLENLIMSHDLIETNLAIHCLKDALLFSPIGVIIL